MVEISASQVKELRDRTGLGMMDCRKALAEAGGDIERAIDELRKSSGMKAAKKAGRIASDGLVGIRIAQDGKSAVMVEVNCETDFAAKNENFRAFVERVSSLAFEKASTDVAGLLQSGLEQERQALVQKIGENISVRRARHLQTEGRIGSYIHNGKIGVLVDMTGGDEELLRDIAMHVAAANPLVVSAEEMPAETVAKEREIYTAQAQESGKPPEILERMIDGKIRKFLAENSLVDQAFVKNPDLKIAALLKQAKAKVNRFVRFEVGEGIEVAVTDFAAEVAAQLKK